MRTVGPAFGKLTPQQRRILALVAGGHDAQGIAEQLGISPATVRTHRQNILTRYGVHTSPAAVSVALILGEITSGDIGWIGSRWKEWPNA